MQLNINTETRLGDFVLSVDESVHVSGVMALLGPSGSGKTTLLRTLCGLERRARGLIRVDGEAWLNTARKICLPVHRRGVGMMFQTPYMFPHMSVRGNLLYGWRRKEQREGPDLDTVLDVLDLGHLLDNRGDQLSGGERQRAALGRTLLSAPRMLLLDEPLSAQDPRRKSEILPYLKRTIGEFDLPVIYVSHAVDEVMTMASHVLHIHDGKIQAADRIEAEHRPELEPLLVKARQHTKTNDGLAKFSVGGSEIVAESDLEARPGSMVLLAIDPSNMLVSTESEIAALNAGSLPCTIRAIHEQKQAAGITLELNGNGKLFRFSHPLAGRASPELRVGQLVFLTLARPARIVGERSGSGRRQSAM